MIDIQQLSTTQSIDYRPIKSFVHRRSYFSQSQQANYQRLFPVFGIAYTPIVNNTDTSVLNFTHVFANNNPVILEIGFGMGETTAEIAKNCPHLNFLGIEVYNTGVATLLKRIETLNLNNVRIIQQDAVEVLQTIIPLNSLSGVHIFCPDPWPKKRHKKRRLIQTAFIQQLQSHLKIGAYIHCATDVKDYAEQMLSVLSKESNLKNLSPYLSSTMINFNNDSELFGYHPPQNPCTPRPTTKFESRGKRLGHGMWDIVFEKINLI